VSRHLPVTDRSTKLLDILDPPGNPWLRDLSRGRAKVPAGVRVLRHCEVESAAIDRRQARKDARQKSRTVAGI
jgi:hypothetical protein